MDTLLKLEGCEVDLESARVTREDGGLEMLSPTELRLLTAMQEHAGELLTKWDLQRVVWGDEDPESTALVQTMRRLRIKVERDPQHPRHLVTVRGEGYRFEVEESAGQAPTLGGAELRLSDDVVVDTASLRLFVRGVPSVLSAQEGRLLERLAETPGKTVDRDVLIRSVWGSAYTSSRALDNAVRRLRNKIEPNHKKPSILLTDRGVGYRLATVESANQWVATDLIGRERDLVALRQLVSRPGMVTITGPPGVGKTALLRAVSRSEKKPLLDCSNATTHEVLLAVVSGGLGTVEATIDSIGLSASSGPTPLLLLDNLEQAIPAAVELCRELLNNEPELRIVTTSRVPLQMVGERLHELVPLTDEAARRLFLARGRRWGATDIEDGENLAGLIHQLDGLPLAVELAAAQARSFSLADIRRLVDAHLDPPRGGDRPARHATLDAMVGWSWQLLSDQAQSALECLALVPGTLKLDCVQAVVGEDLSVTVGLIDELVGHHLLIFEEGRYRLLETVRRFAHQGQPAGTPVFRRLVGWAAGRAGPPRLEHDAPIPHGDAALIEFALERALELGDESAPGIASYVGWLRHRQGPYDNLNLTANAAASLGHPVVQLQHARLLIQQRDLDSARKQLEAIERPALPPDPQAMVCVLLARIHRRQGDLDAAQAAVDEAAASDAVDSRVVAFVLTEAGLVCRNRGDEASAIRRLHEALELVRGSGSVAEGAAMWVLGQHDLNDGRLESALARFGAAGDIYRSLGHLRGALGLELLTASHHSEPHRAVEALTLVHRQAAELGDPRLVSAAAHELVLAGLRAGHVQWAGQLLEQTRARACWRLEPIESIALDTAVALVAAHKGDEVKARMVLESLERRVRELSYWRKGVILAELAEAWAVTGDADEALRLLAMAEAEPGGNDSPDRAEARMAIQRARQALKSTAT